MAKSKLKKFLKNSSVCRCCIDEDDVNTLILIVVSCFLFLGLLSGSLAFGADLVDLSMSLPNQENMSETKSKADPVNNNEAFDRILDLNGVVGIDGSLRVLETNYNKIFDLVNVSTPVAPATGHCRIWLNSSDGDLKVLFDNGIAKTLATN